ncbi:hypothetical protein [Synechococcus sp. CC9616]|uniref:hypothetical protein n=1 Tax=Synechococcus sp. CC9616 TaxID=110663 RepID=UPI0012EB47F7|nr:hypothetical protein [Synechococcus sp. CC9616]
MISAESDAPLSLPFLLLRPSNRSSSTQKGCTDLFTLPNPTRKAAPRQTIATPCAGVCGHGVGAVLVPDALQPITISAGDS